MVKVELIRAEHITFSYSRKPVLTDVSLSVKQGEIVSLLGPNGSGKTTLLKVILGIYPPKLGTVFFNGRSVSEIAPKELAKRLRMCLSSQNGFCLQGYGYRADGKNTPQIFFLPIFETR
ncbi:MAG: ATP-binding cassette domain-containing protein [Desulfobacteraceae bacterium]|nr:ATP-binding cassette domain-containing protein [Desulfobacteraceae bacterium]